MDTLLYLKIADLSQIAIFVPKFPHKVNYFYKPSPELHGFDEVTVIYEKKEQRIFILKEALQEILVTSTRRAEKLLNNSAILPKEINKGELGKQYNIDIYFEKDDFPYDKFLFLSGVKIQVWMYNYENEIYIEIAPTWEWLFKDHEEDEKFIPFDEFIKNYEPYAFFKIDRNELIQFKQQCDGLIKKLGIDTEPGDSNGKRIFVDAEHYG